MYCDVEFVHSLDTNNITDDIPPRVIEKHIFMAEAIVNHYTHREFTKQIDFAIEKATAILVLFLLSDNLTDNKEVIEERIDVVTVKYGRPKTLPRQVEMLLRPYVNKVAFIKKA